MNTDFITKSGKSVYHDLDFPDADTMQRKAMLVAQINKAAAGRGLTENSKITGIPGVKLTEIMVGKFRDVEETTLAKVLRSLQDN